MTKLIGVSISDFNTDNLAAYLNNNEDAPLIDMHTAPYGQVMQVLVDARHDAWQQGAHFALIWTRPEGVIEGFKQALDYQPVKVDAVLAEVDAFADLILNAASRVDTVLVPSWVIPTYERGMGMLDLKADFGLRNILMQMNLRLSQRLNEASNVFVLASERWIEAVGSSAFNPKLWYMAKVAFGNNVFKEAVQDIKAALTGILGGAKKLVILDLDDTLWGGIVGDAGWQNLKLGGHDPVGEAFVHFQQALKKLTRRGIILGIASKNDEAVALEAIENHPEMVLRKEDFAGWKINWHDKAQNILELVQELNLGLQSVVFIDDNPFERARVREALPEVYVPEWPQDKMLYQQTLRRLNVFDSPSFSEEDVARALMYQVERQRNELKQQLSSLDDWLATLGVEVRIEHLNQDNLPRTAQLLNKTNQMNLSTRRMTEEQLLAWVQQEDHQLWTFRVGDKFGDQGLTGIMSVEAQDNKVQIIDFVLSCRVMGRKVEETMLAVAVDHARRLQRDEVYAVYLPTEKNRPCLDFWIGSGFVYHETDRSFHWPVGEEYPFPEQITLVDLAKPEAAPVNP